MHLHPKHVEPHVPTLRQLIRDNPLGVLVTALPSPNHSTIQCTHIPWILDVADEADEAELGTLRGHLARMNPHSKALAEAVVSSNSTNTNSDGRPANGPIETEVSVLFTATDHAYVRPQFYVATKPTTGKVVPTWNYAAAQAYGRARVFCDSADPDTSAFLRRQVDDLSRHAEAHVAGHTGPENGRPPPWKVTDAPERYIELLSKNIIGIEIKLTRLEGKWKMSQEMGEEDRNGVAAGFAALGTENGAAMAKMVEERAALMKKPGAV
ncbi:hypothetical protein MAPG_10471 [Magnaporthiopsis poae ATCC 64411]|uniref:Transcriptional regulator n=1 Tax=Magnaporthiopsis poae (strain ATCC 64411 / 73-15) TaxID=644358 RepID=A0A0C4ECP0_MAGP6|nr:hypothetical protein MAPG_10471 [Magnaporthiopsis poae ATCC 64411]